jgi:hypothetical protein
MTLAAAISLEAWHRVDHHSRKPRDWPLRVVDRLLPLLTSASDLWLVLRSLRRMGLRTGCMPLGVHPSSVAHPKDIFSTYPLSTHAHLLPLVNEQRGLYS